MNVRSILQHVITATIPLSRRNRRSSDFQPLTPFDPDLHEANPSNTSNGGGRPGRSHEQDPFMQQPPIEMKSLKKGKRASIHTLGKSQEESCANADNDESSDLVPPPIQVYNPTSEALPEEEAFDTCSQFGFPDVRLAIQEVFGGDEENNGSPNEANLEEDDNDLNLQGRRKPESGFLQFLCSSCICCSGKQQAITMSAILAGLGCIFVTLLIVGLLGLNESSVPHEHLHEAVAHRQDKDMEVLRRQKWPLHDIFSRNISFDTMARAHQIWDFDKEDSKEDDGKREKERSKLLKNSTRMADNDNANNRVPKINGVILNATVIAESFTAARGILSRLRGNSSTLEILSWKGLAGAVAIEELMLKASPSAAHYNISIEGFLPNDLCSDNPKSLNADHLDLECNHAGHFRSINGHCNNVINPSWGSQYSPLRRIIDFVPPKGEHDDALLQSPDKISSKVHGGSTRLDLNTSALLPFWGMLILHDTVKVADSPLSSSCCNKNVPSHPNAHEVNDKDMTCSLKSVLPYTHGGLSQVNDTDNDDCSSLLPFPAIYPSCDMDEPRSAFNLATSYIDASNIYGSSPDLSNKLRLRKNGSLRMQPGKHNHTYFLLRASGENETCFHSNPINANVPNCFLSGDPAVNQVAVLTSLNTILVRQHNRIAFWLKRLNTKWDDDRLFEESRKILIAQIQHITYNEFLPEILGKEMMEVGGLTLEKADFYQLYDPVVDPTVSNAFAGAVGHFWLSMVSGKAKSIWGKAKITTDAEFSIDRLFYLPRYLMMHRGNLEAILTGFMSLNSNRVGVEVSSQLRSLHLNLTNSTFDMVKMIIQRGRDLEIAPYVEWRKKCGFPEIKYLTMLKGIWEPEAFEKISQVYKHAHQIDLFTGMLAEKPIRSGRVGPTLACLLTDQFLRFKKGDRFWYEGHLYSGHFTPEQLKEIRKTTLARIICDNTDEDFQELQRWPMLASTPDSNTNPVLLCVDSRIPKLNFHFWKEGATGKWKNQEESSIEDDDDWYIVSGASQSPDKIGPPYSVEVDNVKNHSDKHFEVGVEGNNVTNSKIVVNLHHTETKSKSVKVIPGNTTSAIDHLHPLRPLALDTEQLVWARKKDSVRVRQNEVMRHRR